MVSKWKNKPKTSRLQGERIIGAMRAGLRYVRHSPALVSVMVRSAVFAGSSCSMWALLPLIGREQLKLDSIGYGLMLSVFGLGCIIGAFILPILRRHMTLDHLNSAGNVLFAASIIMLAFAKHFVVASAAMLLAGAAWIVVNASMNMAAQMAVPAWVRARAMAVYILVFQGSVALGSILWGQLAARGGLFLPLGISAATMCFNLVIAMKYKLGMVEDFDTSMSTHWKDPKIVHEPESDHGPVLVTVEYVIEPEKAREFADACMMLGRQRLRDGAHQWHLFCDLAYPSRYFESFMIESWGEHVRQHERVMVADKLAEDRVNAFHVGDKPPMVRHLISAYASEIMPSQGQATIRQLS